MDDRMVEIIADFQGWRKRIKIPYNCWLAGVYFMRQNDIPEISSCRYGIANDDDGIISYRFVKTDYDDTVFKLA